jgi:predicted metal-binding protein
MSIYPKTMEKAASLGFVNIVPIKKESLIFREEVRAMCRADRCQSYGKTWSCPPACGTLDELRARIAPFTEGILFETVGVMEDEFDYEAIEEAAKRHKVNFHILSDHLREQGADIFPMGAGRCTLCKVCTYPDAPCRFPEKMTPSMEAAGLLVSDVCKQCGAPYYNGKNTTTFISCILWK